MSAIDDATKIAADAVHVGTFIMTHSDLLGDLAKAIAKGTPVEVLRAAIRAAQEHLSEMSLEEEFDAANKRSQVV